MKSFNYKIVFLILSIVFLSCTHEHQNKKETKEVYAEKKVNTTACPEYLIKNKKNNLNISILLDLSDRINKSKYPNPTMEYFQRDLGYITTIANSFLQHVAQKKLVLINDKIQIYFEPEPADITINEKSKELKTAFTRDLSKGLLVKTKEDYTNIPKEIYSLAQKDGKYAGSDTWRFFKDKAKRYCVDECSRNILVILTDGYLYHEDTKIKEVHQTSYITPSILRNLRLNKSNWKRKMEDKNIGFIPATDKLDDLEVLLIGLVNHDKKANPYGKEVLEEFWATWFENMGIKKYEIYGADLPSNMEKTITEFILK